MKEDVVVLCLVNGQLEIDQEIMKILLKNVDQIDGRVIHQGGKNVKGLEAEVGTPEKNKSKSKRKKESILRTGKINKTGINQKVLIRV